MLPGLVNTHTHAPMVLYRGLADDLPLMEWLNNYIFPAESKTVSPEFVRAGTQARRARDDRVGHDDLRGHVLLRGGDRRETRRAGLRGVLGQTIIQFPVADAKTPADALARADAFITSFKNDPLITPAVAPHAIYTLDGPTLRAARELSKRHNVPTLIHLAETSDETKVAQERLAPSPVAYLEGLGFLGPGVLGAHGVWVSDADMQILKMRGVGHLAQSGKQHEDGERRRSGSRLSEGRCRRSVSERTGRRATTTSTCSRPCAWRRCSTSTRRRIRPRSSARAVLEMATIRGARALGMEARIGSIEPRKRADLITVSASGARQTPMYDPISHLVYVIHGDDVRNTIVNGQVADAEPESADARRASRDRRRARVGGQGSRGGQTGANARQRFDWPSRSLTTARWGRLRWRSPESSPYPTTNRSSMVKPT